MRRFLMASTILAVPFAAAAQTIRTGTIDGLNYETMTSPDGCSTATPCQIVTYLHYLGGESATPSDLQTYFNNSQFWAANPHTIVVAPMVNGSSTTSNWGGVQAGVSPNMQAAVDLVKQVEATTPTNPNSVVVTGGSMGGIGTESAMIEYGPKGTTGQHVFTAGLSYDGATYNVDTATAKAALCGVPYTMVHGTADTTVPYSFDQSLAGALQGCSGFNFVPVQGATHGTWNSPDWKGYGDGTLINQSLATARANGGSNSTTPAMTTTTSTAAPTATPAASAALATPTGTTTTQPASPCSNAVPNYAASAGGFGVLDGQIYAPGGQPFVARGINVMHGNGDPSAAEIQAAFPGTNFVRLAIYNYDSPAALTAYVSDLTSHGIVVVLEDHNNGAGNAGGATGTIFTGAALAREQAWYSSIASAFKTNPYVWFGTNNEPSENPSAAALSAWQKQTYQSIRSAGNNNPVLLEANSWGPGQTNVGYTASDYAGMTNAIWDLHYYGWVSGYSTNQSTVSSTLASMIADTHAIKSADGRMPVLIGEYGNSTTGQAIDPNGDQVVSAVQQAAQSGQMAGSAAWAWGTGNPGDGLTNGNGIPSAYGQQVAAYTAGSGSQGCAQSPIANPIVQQSPAASAQPAASTADIQTPASVGGITPGVGTATDAAGNAYQITANGSIQENGQWMPGGGGTSQLVIVNGVVYGKDDGHGPINPGGWFTFSGGYWTPSAPPPGATQPETAPPLAPAATAMTAPPLAAASTVQTAPALAASPLSIDQLAALAQ